VSEQPPARPLFARRAGEGPAVVLLHGQPGSSTDWDRVVSRLEADHALIVPDRPGYGRTGGPAKGFRDNASAVAHLLDRCEVPSAVVVGHSWGAGVAIALAEGHPSRVSALVLVAPVVPGAPVRLDDRILAAPVLGELIAGATIGLTGVVLGSRLAAELSDRALGGRTRDALRTLTALTRGDSAAVWRSFLVEQRALFGELDGLAPGLGTLAVPTTVLQGDADHLVSPRAARRLASAIQGANLRMVAGGGHFLTFDRPDTVAEAVRQVAASSQPRGEGAGGGQTDR